MASLLHLISLLSFVLLVQSYLDIVRNDNKQCNKNDDSPEVRLPAANHKLSVECLYALDKKGPGKSHMTSIPYVLAILGQLALFSTEPTKSEILQILKLKSTEEIKEIFPNVVKTFNFNGHNKFTWKIKLNVNSSRIYSKDFKDSFKKYFSGETSYVNFAKPYRAAREINNWFDCQIPYPGHNALRRESINKDVGMVFANTYDAKVILTTKFNILSTRNIAFHVDEKRTLQVPAIEGIGAVKHGEIGSNGNAYLLPLKDSNSKLLMISGNVPELLKLFLSSKFNFLAFLEGLEYKKLKLTFPHINEVKDQDFVEHFQLANVLTQMFKPHGSDFKEVFLNDDCVHVSHMLQRMKMTVNEGLKHIGDTQGSSHDVDVPNHIIDGPFIYFLLCQKNSPMVCGTCYGDCVSNNEDAERKVAWANTALTTRLLYDRLTNYPEQSHSVAGLPILTLIAQAALHSEGYKFQELARWLNLNNKHEIRQVLPSIIKRMINDTNIDLTFNAFADKDLSKEFRDNFKYTCGGDVAYVNYSKVSDVAENINYWFKKQFSESSGDVIDSDYLRHRKEGFVLTSYMETRTNFDHPLNPKGVTDIIFQKSKYETQKLVALHGIGLVRYAELPELNAKMLMLSAKGEQNAVVWLYPVNPDDLLTLVSQIQDPKVLYEAYGKLKTTCLKLHITIGQSHSVNRFPTVIPQLNIALSDLSRVYSNDGNSTNVYCMLQQLHLIADKVIKDGPINSPACPDHDYPLVQFNHPFVYFLLNKFHTPIFAGVYYGI